MPGEDVFPLREGLAITSDGATSVDIRTDVVEEGWHWLVTAYAGEDETSAATFLRFYVESGGFPFLLSEQRSPLAANLYHADAWQVLGSGDRFGALFNGSSDGDILRLYVHGWKYPPNVPVIYPQQVRAGQSAHPVPVEEVG